MGVYIEEGPELPEHVSLETDASGTRVLVWASGPRVSVEATGGVGRELAVAAKWIVVREEEPTPPTPDVRWIGTHIDTGCKLTALLFVGDWFIYEDDSYPVIAKIDHFTWEPPPEEAEPDPRLVELFERPQRIVVGIQEPDPQPIAWVSIGQFGTRQVWSTEREAKRRVDQIGGTVHAVMPAGWRPGEQGEQP